MLPILHAHFPTFPQTEYKTALATAPAGEGSEASGGGAAAVEDGRRRRGQGASLGQSEVMTQPLSQGAYSTCW